jgi:hypothetical protein
MITKMSQDYPVKLLCDLLDLPRSTYYCKRQDKAGEKELQKAIEKIIVKKPYYGYRGNTCQEAARRAGTHLSDGQDKDFYHRQPA